MAQLQQKGSGLGEETEMPSDVHLVALGEAAPVLLVLQRLQIYLVVSVPKPRAHKTIMKSPVRFHVAFQIQSTHPVFQFE